MSMRHVWAAVLVVVLGGQALADHVVTTRDARVARRLGEVRDVSPIGYGDWVQLVTLKNGAKWVFRPEHNRHNKELIGKHKIAPGTQVLRDRAFYLTSRHLRLGVVPQLVRGELDGAAGSLQRYVEDKYHGAAKLPADTETQQAVAILHYVTRLADGHDGNVVLTDVAGKTRFRAIDGELSFGHAWTMSVVIDQVAGEQLSPRLKRRLDRVDVDAWRAALLAEGLANEDVAGAVRRFQRVREHGLAALRMPPD
jgi:hypothetical protein